jgi:choline dehydrogenase-like flavoprotein
MPEALQRFDYIVSAAGSAGRVVVARLGESGKYSVLLLEAGPEDTAFWSKVPIGCPMSFTDEPARCSRTSMRSVCVALRSRCRG